MCQLLGMNSSQPASIHFSFEGFARRGGQTDEHADGWGIAFFEGRGCRLIIDDQSSASSPLAELIKRYPIKSRNVIAHIRKATQGATKLENCHPFMRELWGRYWIFAHNGDLKDYAPRLDGRYHPVGETDSEHAFCQLLQSLHARFGDTQPPDAELFKALQEETRCIATHGSFNYMLSNGEQLFVHCSTDLCFVSRQFPFTQARLVDCDMSMDFAQHNHPDDLITIIATQPLTSNEIWTRMAPGELRLFAGGVQVKGDAPEEALALLAC